MLCLTSTGQAEAQEPVGRERAASIAIKGVSELAIATKLARSALFPKA